MSASDELNIVLDNSPPSYLPRQEISGKVEVHTKKGVRAKGLTITFHGDLHVTFSEQVEVRKSFGRRSSFNGRRFSDYEYRTFWYSSHQDILHYPIQLINGRYDFPPGVHNYPFKFRLPDKVLTSFKCGSGRVEYSLQAALDVEGSSGAEWSIQMFIPVLALMNLRGLPQLNQPEEAYDEKTFGRCCPSEPVRMWLTLPKTGYYPGEIIEFQVRFDNKSDREVNDLTAELCEDVACNADGHCKSECNVIQSIQRGQSTPTQGEDIWSGKLQVPGTVPSKLGNMDQGLIIVKHYVKVRNGIDSHPSFFTDYAFVFPLLHTYAPQQVTGSVEGQCCGGGEPYVLCNITIGSYPPKGCLPLN